MTQLTPAALNDLVLEGTTPLQLRQMLFKEHQLDPNPSWNILTVVMREERIRLLMGLRYTDGQTAVVLETTREQVSRLRHNYGIQSQVRSARSGPKAASSPEDDTEFEAHVGEMWGIRRRLGIGPRERVLPALPADVQAEIRQLARDFRNSTASRGSLGGLTPLDKLIR